jgi:hypothetical protein
MSMPPSRASKARKNGHLARVQAAFTGAPLTPHAMPVSRLFLSLALLLVGSNGSLALAADTLSHRAACLTKAEQRVAVATKRAISLGQAIKLLREQRRHSDVVRARLCRHDEKLVYVLTLLGRSGKVVVVTIDATSGEFHIAR